MVNQESLFHCLMQVSHTDQALTTLPSTKEWIWTFSFQQEMLQTERSSQVKSGPMLQSTLTSPSKTLVNGGGTNSTPCTLSSISMVSGWT